MYFIGWPLWKVLGKLGITLLYRVEIFRDTEANVFIATSPDIKGLICEASTMEELMDAVRWAAHELIIDDGKEALPIIKQLAPI